jgi:hypothetical protein
MIKVSKIVSDYAIKNKARKKLNQLSNKQSEGKIRRGSWIKLIFKENWNAS